MNFNEYIQYIIMMFCLIMLQSIFITLIVGIVIHFNSKSISKRKKNF
jgi:hypothetical protein